MPQMGMDPEGDAEKDAGEPPWDAGAQAGGKALPILKRDGKLIPPPGAYTVKVILESPDGTLTNTMFDVSRAWLSSPAFRIAGISEMLKAADWAIYHAGEPIKPTDLNRIHGELTGGN